MKTIIKYNTKEIDLKKAIIACLAFVLPLSISFAEEIQSDKILFKMARTEWSPVQLKSHGLTDDTFSQKEMEKRVKQAVIWLEAAQRFNANNAYVLGDLEYLYRSEMIDDPGRTMNTLIPYSDLKPKDNLCVEGWMKYRLAQLDKLSYRDYFIESMEQNLADYPMVLSDMLTLRGVYSAEQGDIDKAAALYESAWNIWPNNIDAAARLLALPLPQVNTDDTYISSEQQVLLQQQIEQNHILRSIYYQVMSLTNNPLNLDDTIGFADLLYSLNKFEKASVLYSHSLKLLNIFDNDNSKVMIQGLGFKKAICLYNIGKYKECLLTLENSKQAMIIDLPTTALHILAYNKIGKTEKVEKLLNDVDQFANNELPSITDNSRLNQIHTDLAWLYCFANNDPEKALSYASKISVDDNGCQSPLLAYLQVLSGDNSTAENTIKDCPQGYPLTVYSSAILELNRSHTEEASELLLIAQDSAPGMLYTFINSKLNQINVENKLNSSQHDVVDTILKHLSEDILDVAINPQKSIQYSISPTQKYFKFNDFIYADLSITNISSYDRIIGPKTIIDPYVYIYAEIVPLVRNKSIKPKILPIALRYLAQEPILKPGFSNSFQEVLNISMLDDILKLYPQMSYKVKFHCIPSPYINDSKVYSATPLLQPKPVVIERRAFEPSPQRLSSYYSMLRSGQPGERIKSANLFTAILKENQLAAKGKLFYESTRLDYDRTIKTILANVSHENALIRAWTIHSLSGLLKDKKVLNTITSKLEDPDWFVRLIALSTLKKSVNIDSVIEWFAENEKDETVLRQIQLWQGEKWDVIQVPFDISAVELSK